MKDRRTITVTVHEWDEDFDVPAKDFLAQLAGLIELVPEPFRAAAMFEFDRTGDDYDYSRGEMSLYYQRPETDDEIRARAQYEERRITEAEARERSELARLRSKYPSV